ncbi:MAG TPA: hypothetical protein VGL04_02500 [Sporichthyaceae bacterium]
MALNQDNDDCVLARIVAAFSFTHSDEVTETLLLLAGHPDDAVRYFVTDALSARRVLSPAVRQRRIQLAGDEDLDARFTRLGAWQREQPDPEILDTLRAATHDCAHLVARTAVEALQRDPDGQN